MAIGYIYVLSNSAMSGLLKIGYTTKDVKERVQELSNATGVPEPFQIEYYYLTCNVEEVENRTHKHFSSKRVKGKEFFNIEAEEAVKFINTIVKEVKPDSFSRVTLQEEIQVENLSPQRRLKCLTCRSEWNSRKDLKVQICPICGKEVQERIGNEVQERIERIKIIAEEDREKMLIEFRDRIIKEEREKIKRIKEFEGQERTIKEERERISKEQQQQQKIRSDYKDTYDKLYKIRTD
jgi:hypothetical protein